MRPQLIFTLGLVLLASLGEPDSQAAPPGSPDPLPIARLAHVTVRGGDLDKARRFYGTILGFEEAPPVMDATGKEREVTFKINDDQFLTFLAAGTAEEKVRLTKVSLLTPEIRRAQEQVRERMLSPGEIHKEADGNPHFAFTDRDGNIIDFVEYVSGSRQAELRGKALGARRVAIHLQHAGLPVASEAGSMALYREKLGFWETRRGGPAGGNIRWINMMMPGTQGDYVELMIHAEDPPERRQHICFAVPDMDVAYKLLAERGLPQFKPFAAQTGTRLMNARDPQGFRVEFMEVRDKKGP